MVLLWRSTDSVGTPRQYVTRLEVAGIGSQKRAIFEGPLGFEGLLGGADCPGSFTWPIPNPRSPATSRAIAIDIQANTLRPADPLAESARRASGSTRP